MKILLLFFILASELFSAPLEQACVVLSFQGEIEVREPYQKDWKPVPIGAILEDRETIRCQNNSSAKIKTFDGSFFTLPANAQIEIGELKKLDKNDVIMELTILEVQKLPQQVEPSKRNNAFILHGSLPDSVNVEEIQNYVSMETNGALALFNQGFISGFIIKWNKLTTIYPNVSSEKTKAALIKACKLMDMPARLKELTDK